MHRFEITRAIGPFRALFGSRLHLCPPNADFGGFRYIHGDVPNRSDQPMFRFQMYGRSVCARRVSISCDCRTTLQIRALWKFDMRVSVGEGARCWKNGVIRRRRIDRSTRYCVKVPDVKAYNRSPLRSGRGVSFLLFSSLGLLFGLLLIPLP